MLVLALLPLSAPLLQQTTAATTAAAAAAVLVSLTAADLSHTHTPTLPRPRARCRYVVLASWESEEYWRHWIKDKRQQERMAKLDALLQKPVSARILCSPKDDIFLL